MTASLDYTIGYAEAAGGEPLPPGATPAYAAGWFDYFEKERGVWLQYHHGFDGATWRFVEGQ